MAARPTMTDLIAKMRVLIGDPSGVNQVFSDDDIQFALDDRRDDRITAELQQVPSYAPGGVTEYRTYYADSGWWEGDPLIQDSQYNTLSNVSTPIAISTADLVTGKWTFSASLDGPVYITGNQYDIYGAAADLLDTWSAKVKLEFDFLELNATFKASQQIDMLDTLVKRYRRRQWMRSSEYYRTDLN